MASDHERFRRDLGVYVLGGLEPGERDGFEEHLATCDQCRDELADLAVLPSLLGRLPVPEDGGPVAPPPVGSVLRRIAAEQGRARRRARLLGTLAAAASLVAAVVVALALVGPPAPAGAEFLADDRAATATVQARDWGMVATLRVSQLPARDGYTAVAVRADGHRAQLASWSAADGAIELQGSCYLGVEEVVRIEILAARSDEVVSVLEPV